MAFRIRTVDRTASGREIVRERSVAGNELVIGRAAENAIHLPDLAVEQQHVRAFLESDDRLELQAIGSLGFTLDGRSSHGTPPSTACEAPAGVARSRETPSPFTRSSALDTRTGSQGATDLASQPPPRPW